MSWKQRVAVFLLIASLTFIAITEPEHHVKMILALAGLLTWTVERKEKK